MCYMQSKSLIYVSNVSTDKLSIDKYSSLLSIMRE